MIKHLLTFGCHAGELNHFFFLNCWQKVTKLPRNISSSFWKCFRSMNSSWLMVSPVTQLVNQCVDYSGWIVKSYLRSVLFTLHNKLMGFYFIVPFSLRCCQAVSARGKRFILKAKHIKIMGNILMVVFGFFGKWLLYKQDNALQGVHEKIYKWHSDRTIQHANRLIWVVRIDFLVMQTLNEYLNL